MNLPWPFSLNREVIAGLRDQVIEHGTTLRFLVADKPVPQPRDPDGKFVSKRELKRRELQALYDATPVWQRDAAKSRASTKQKAG